MNKLIILSGVPGSGKSYFSNTLKKIRPSHTYIISSDDLRRTITGSQTNLDYDPLMWKMYSSLAFTYSMDKEGIVVLDATHINPGFRVDKYRDLAKEFDEVYLVMWNTKKEVVINQNLQREYPLPPEAMEMFFNNFELPTPKDEEFFDKIIIVENNNIASAIETINLEIPFKAL